jgi:hypothetical protein
MSGSTNPGPGGIVPYDPACGRPVIVTPERVELAKLRAEIARLREFLHRIEDAETLELAINEAGRALYS